MAAARWRIEQIGGENLAVGGHDVQVRGEFTQTCQRFPRIGVLGLEDGDPRFHRRFLHRIDVVMVPATGPIRLCHETHHVVVRSEQRPQRRHSKRTSSQHQQSQRHGGAAPSFLRTCLRWTGLKSRWPCSPIRFNSLSKFIVRFNLARLPLIGEGRTRNRRAGVAVLPAWTRRCDR